MPQDFGRLKEAAKRGELGKEVGDQLYTAARKVTGFISGATAGSKYAIPQREASSSGAMAEGAKASAEAVRKAKATVKRTAQRVTGR